MFTSAGPAAQAAGRPGRAGNSAIARGRPARARAAAAAAAVALVGGLAACGGSTHASGGGTATGTLTFADVAPFSGADAALGPTYLVSCEGAVQAINKAGGVLGHKVGCTSADTRGDPADAVPAVGSLFNRTKNLELVIGCTSDEAATVVPVINSHKTVMFCMTGQSEFDHVQYPYFYRLVPPDLAESYAMTVIAQNLGYKQDRARLRQRHRVADLRPARRVAAIAKAGLTLVANETLDLNATTFRTEAREDRARRTPTRS